MLPRVKALASWHLFLCSCSLLCKSQLKKLSIYYLFYYSIFDIFEAVGGDSMDSYGVGPRNCDEQEETSNLRPRAGESNTVVWTDEKHSLYLKYMEATFVDQLNKSLNLLGRQSGPKSSKHKFKVLRDGRWCKTDLREGEAETRQEESRDLSANPWIQHYRCSETERHTNRKVVCLATTSVNQDSVRNFRLWSRDFVGTSAEVTDQNFNEEDLEEDKSCSARYMKRTRTSICSRVPSYDQVVSSKIIVEADDVAEGHVQPED